MRNAREGWIKGPALPFFIFRYSSQESGHKEGPVERGQTLEEAQQLFGRHLGRIVYDDQSSIRSLALRVEAVDARSLQEDRPDLLEALGTLKPAARKKRSAIQMKGRAVNHRGNPPAPEAESRLRAKFEIPSRPRAEAPNSKPQIPNRFQISKAGTLAPRGLGLELGAWNLEFPPVSAGGAHLLIAIVVCGAGPSAAGWPGMPEKPRQP